MSNSLQQIQRELALLGAVTNKLREVDAHLVRQVKTEQEAYRLCIDKSPVHRPDADWAEICGVSRSVFNRAKNGDSYKVNYPLSRVAQERLQVAAQNTAIDQWAKAYRMGDLNCQRDTESEIAELETRLQQLRAGAY